VENENLKYAKRNWSKDNLRLLSVENDSYNTKDGVRNFHRVIMYVSKRKVAFNCYNPDVVEVLSKTNPQEKVKVWFVCESRKHNGRWYSDLTLKWVEVPRIEEMNKLKTEMSSGIGVFTQNEDF
jgi:hypothetical protein